jgi:CRISPR-associated protein Csb2
MTRYLCISVTFLDRLFHGKADSEEPEWPPSPFRLFQALLAGSVVGCRKNEWADAHIDAFRWLQNRKPPLIVAPKVRCGTTYTFYVPRNESDKVFKRQDRLDTKIARPHCLMNGQTLHYLWGIDENEWPSVRCHAELLSHESRHLLALGWGVDLVAGNGKLLMPNEAALLSGQRWMPREGVWLQKGTRRVPTEGSLEDLKGVHESFLESVKGGVYRLRLEPSAFRTVPYLLETAMPPRPAAAFELRKPNGDWATLRHVDAANVAAMLRKLASQSAEKDSHKFPGGWESYVKGQKTDETDSSPRFSCLPLPTTRHKHADGLIRRVLIAEPFGGGAQALWAARRFIGQDLIDDHGEILATLSDCQSVNRDVVLRAYVDRAKAWSSITPVVLPGFDDGKYEKAKRLFLKALQYCGLPL